uniref:Uncharacterized protein n=1 Tax=Setaria italica TaxID=4555 RepID=K4AHY8_SETIT
MPRLASATPSPPHQAPSSTIRAPPSRSPFRATPPPHEPSFAPPDPHPTFPALP